MSLTPLTYGNLIGIVGLMLDILGAIFLARGTLIKTNDQIKLECGTYYGFNGKLELSMLSQRMEGRFGILFLLSGFFSQSIVYLTSLIPILQKKIIYNPYIIILLVIITGVILNFISKKICGKLFTLETLSDTKKLFTNCNKEEQIKSARYFLARLSLEPQENENNESIAARLEAYLGRKSTRPL